MSTTTLSKPSRLLTPKQTAEYLGKSISALAEWRQRTLASPQEPIGPPFIKDGDRFVRYRESDLQDWLKSRTVGATKETREPG